MTSPTLVWNTRRSTSLNVRSSWFEGFSLQCPSSWVLWVTNLLSWKCSKSGRSDWVAMKMLQLLQSSLSCDGMINIKPSLPSRKFCSNSQNDNSNVSPIMPIKYMPHYLYCKCKIVDLILLLSNLYKNNQFMLYIKQILFYLKNIILQIFVCQ